MVFLNSIYFYAFLCLAIPIFIHFFGTRKYKKVFISNIEHLVAIKKSTVSVNRILHLLLLLMRLSLLAFLVLAFLNPVKPGSYMVESTKAKYFFDNSPSVCENGIIGMNAIQNRVLTDSLSNPQSLNGDCSYNSTGLLKAFLNQNKGLSLNKIIVSDFQSSFTNKIDTATKDQLSLVHFENDSRKFNVFVDSLWVSENFIKPNLEMVLYVKLKNSGLEEAKDAIVEYKLNDVSVSSKAVNISAGRSEIVSFPLFLKSAGNYPGKIVIKDNSWNFDNQFHFSISTADNVNILYVSSGTAGIDPVSLAYSQENIFNIKSIQSNSSNNDLIQKSSLIIVNNKLSSVATFINAVKDGKTLLIFPQTDWTDADFQKLNNLIGQQTLVNSAMSELQVDIPDLNNPFYFNIFEKRPSLSNLPLVNLSSAIKNPNEIILKATNGQALIARYNVGRGSIYVCAFDLTNNVPFSRSALFLPILYKIAERSIKDNVKPYYFSNTTSLDFLSGKMASQDVLSIENLNTKIVPEQKNENGKYKLLLTESGLKPGIWKIKNQKDSTLASFGINIDKAESELSFYTVEELQQKFKNNSNIKVVKSTDFEKAQKDPSGNGNFKYWKVLVCLSFLFLVLEILVARFYRTNLKPSV
ncbi:MAG: BatA domain-containing protein [Opitutaceae bacterium]|nr:BatA domain-containing protein [Cytophagales bacterium]